MKRYIYHHIVEIFCEIHNYVIMSTLLAYDNLVLFGKPIESAQNLVKFNNINILYSTYALIDKFQDIPYANYLISCKDQLPSRYLLQDRKGKIIKT